MVALTPEQRRQKHHQILNSPQRPYGVEARVIFWLEDRAWGTERTLPGSKRELVARSPYRAWADEHDDERSDVEEERNERSHWNVLRQLIEEDKCDESRVRFDVLPAIGALSMYTFTRIQHRLNPQRSYRLNADIEDHAAHEYALRGGTSRVGAPGIRRRVRIRPVRVARLTSCASSAAMSKLHRSAAFSAPL